MNTIKDISNNKKINNIVQRTSIQNDILKNTQLHILQNDLFKIKNDCYTEKNYKYGDKSIDDNNKKSNKNFIDAALKPNKESYDLYKSFTKYNTTDTMINNKSNIMNNL